jgi:N-acetyl-anhydromuramyl-L-alanine amidase AmpD
VAQSPEYPDLKWVPPKSWTDANRTAVQLVVIHTTEGSAHAQSAEDGAAYNQRRTDGTSAHYFHDSDSTVHCVRTADQAHTARRQGNRRGIHHELCGRAGWSEATWQGDYQQAMLRRAAKQCARDARKWNIPVRHLTVAQVAAGEKGFCGHWDITRAFPQDAGTHTDPGQAFPWSQFLGLVRAELEEDDMPTAKEVVDELLVKRTFKNPYDGRTMTYGDMLEYAPSRGQVEALTNQVTALGQSLAAAIQALAARDAVDEQALAVALAPGLAVALAPLLPADRDDVTPAELQDAIVGALRILVERPAA